MVAWVIAEDRAQLGLIVSSGFRQLHMSTTVGSFILSHLQSGCHVPWKGSKFFVIGSVQWNLPPQEYQFLSFVLHCFSLNQECLVFYPFFVPSIGLSFVSLSCLMSAFGSYKNSSITIRAFNWISDLVVLTT